MMKNSLVEFILWIPLWYNLYFSYINTELLFLSVRINDTVTFVEDGLDEDIEFGDEISNDDEDDVDNVSLHIYFLRLILCICELLLL